jgi:hypothetical protein
MRWPALVVLCITSCAAGEDHEKMLARVSLLEEQLTNARNDLAKLRKRVETLESAAGLGPVGEPVPPAAPSVPAAAIAEAHVMATLDVTASTIAVNGVEIADADLDARFKALAEADPDTELVVRADEGVAHGRVVDLLDRARTAGLRKVAMAAIPSIAEPAAPSPLPPY